MKKQLFLLAALAISAIAFAADVATKTSTLNVATATEAGFPKGSYGDMKEAEKSVNVDGVQLLAQAIMRNNKISALDLFGDQVLEFQKANGHFINRNSILYILK